MVRVIKAVLSMALIMLATVVSAGDQKDDLKKEMARFQGKWEQAYAREGPATAIVERPDAFIKEGKMKGLCFLEPSVSFKVNPSKTPAQIDLTYEAGENKGKTVKGIYKFEGNILEICWGTLKEGLRPEEFFDGKEGFGLIKLKLIARFD